MSERFRRLKRVFKGLQTLWSILGITLILILAFELGLRLIFRFKDRSLPPAFSDPRLVSAGYGNEPWVGAMFDESARVEPDWYSYVYFRQKPFHGKYLNIDEKGIRATLKVPATASGSSGTASAKRLKVLMFGGSTMWGFGARDEGTIPSCLARVLAERGIEAEVTNLGEIGYVSSQELITLTRALQSGSRPDLVIFYDGVNDTTAAILDRHAGIPTNEGNRRVEFNVRRKPARLLGLFFVAIIKDSASFRLAGSLLQRMRGAVAAPAPPIALPTLTDASEKRLVDDTVRWYAENVKVVELLGREYGFEPLFYWQPVLFTKPNRGSFETEERYKYSWGEPIFLDVYQRIANEPVLNRDQRWHNISKIFGDSDDVLYTDFCHTTERGNMIIAKAMADDVVATLAGRAKGEKATGPK
jgi:lysophospholipase L1-like esterase